MTAKEYLSQAFYMNRQIKAKERRLEWLREIAPGPSMRFSQEEKSKGDPRSSLVEEAALKVVELEDEIASDILDLVRVMKEIASTISRVDSMECRTILEMRYLSFMEWDEIISRMGYSRSYVFRLHGEALNAIRI